MVDRTLTLTWVCPDRKGIVATVSTLLYQRGCNIRDARQFEDPETGRFFARVMFDAGESIEVLREAFHPVAVEFEMDWSLRARAERRKVMILASRSDHCLADLLYRWRLGELSIDPTAIVANHPRETYDQLLPDAIPFHFLPVAPDTRADQEAQILSLVRETGTELVVLARYMQILSPAFAAALEGRCINIHHSFLPGFKGAKPYHQAYARGVKTIGATAHFVTSDLDEGPIIEQDVERITHNDTPDDLVRKGRDIERRVLSRAVRWWCDDRVLLNGTKTVVFSD